MATNVELARLAFEIFRRDGPEGLLSGAHPEIEVYTERGLANPGTYRGSEAFMRWAEQWLEAWEEYTAEPREFIEVGGSVVVVPTHTKAIGRGSGIPVALDVVFLLALRDGLVTRLHLYGDRETALAAGRRIAAGEA